MQLLPLEVLTLSSIYVGIKVHILLAMTSCMAPLHDILFASGELLSF